MIPNPTQPDPPNPAPPTRPAPTTTDLMILPDGTIYARNLSPELAALLATLNPADPSMAARAGIHTPPSPSSSPCPNP
jgi:hypothetical protein